MLVMLYVVLVIIAIISLFWSCLLVNNEGRKTPKTFAFFTGDANFIINNYNNIRHSVLSEH